MGRPPQGKRERTLRGSTSNTSSVAGRGQNPA
nr:MAG TPA: hypothetical protein [Caudoviricetes sp.]